MYESGGDSGQFLRIRMSWFGSTSYQRGLSVNHTVLFEVVYLGIGAQVCVPPVLSMKLEQNCPSLDFRHDSYFPKVFLEEGRMGRTHCPICCRRLRREEDQEMSQPGRGTVVVTKVTVT